MSRDFLLELGTEEIPARFLPAVVEQYKNIALKKLAEMRVECESAEVYATPRRLVLWLKGLDDEQKDNFSENKGPSVKIAFDADNNPTKACQGFARGQGVSADDLIVKDGYVYAQKTEKGVDTKSLLQGFSEDVFASLSFPKNMRWGSSEDKFVRPVHWIVALYGQELIGVDFCGISSGLITRGHRVLGSQAVAVSSIDDYFVKMRENFVIVDQEERCAMIARQVEEVAETIGGYVAEDQELLQEVVYLVEYPTALYGSFEERYLDIPEEVIITPMREHQRYFPVRSKASNKLMANFITVRNGNDQYVETVRAGNERVLSARLADAAFFFEEDKKRKLIDRIPDLKKVVFQEGLGTMYDKVVRLESAACNLARILSFDDSAMDLLRRAAKLAKTDLQTAMVYEFTELQGIMGRNYARIDGEQEAVCEAIYEHYLPRFAGDELPKTDIGRVLSITEKMDNIVASFSRGFVPTGSQDPYALRRQALGVVLILIDGQYSVSIKELAQCALQSFAIKDAAVVNKVLLELDDFFKLRLKNIFAENGIRYDLADAVLATDTNVVYDAYMRAAALKEFAEQKDFAAFIEAFSRVINIIKNESSRFEVKKELLSEDVEKDLWQSFEAYLQEKGKQEDNAYSEFLALLSSVLVLPINKFFDKVMVMAEDRAVRENRIAILQAIADEVLNTANISKVVL